MYGDNDVIWNHEEFEVNYTCLKDEPRVGNYYIRFLLDKYLSFGIGKDEMVITKIQNQFIIDRLKIQSDSWSNCTMRSCLVPMMIIVSCASRRAPPFTCCTRVPLAHTCSCIILCTCWNRMLYFTT